MRFQQVVYNVLVNGISIGLTWTLPEATTLAGEATDKRRAEIRPQFG